MRAACMRQQGRHAIQGKQLAGLRPREKNRRTATVLLIRNVFRNNGIVVIIATVLYIGVVIVIFIEHNSDAELVVKFFIASAVINGVVGNALAALHELGEGLGTQRIDQLFHLLLAFWI